MEQPEDQSQTEDALRKKISKTCQAYAKASRELADAHILAAQAWEKGDYQEIQKAQILADRAHRDMNFQANMSVLYKQNWVESFSPNSSPADAGVKLAT